MNKKIKLAALFALVIFTFNSCGSVLHNGSVMPVSQILVTGLPAETYPVDQKMVFSYNRSSYGNDWIHDNTDDFTNEYYIASVTADGSLTFNFNPALEVTTPKLEFLLIDPDKTWVIKIASNHSLDGGSNVEFENKWSGIDKPQVIEGSVDGDDVTWNYKGD